jgi:hypothetical protein
LKLTERLMLKVDREDHALGPSRRSEFTKLLDDLASVRPRADCATGLRATVAVGRVAPRDSVRDPLSTICQQLIDAPLVALFGLGQRFYAPVEGRGVELHERKLTGVLHFGASKGHVVLLSDAQAREFAAERDVGSQRVWLTVSVFELAEVRVPCADRSTPSAFGVNASIS